jgi:hypothetical protein
LSLCLLSENIEIKMYICWKCLRMECWGKYLDEVRVGWRKSYSKELHIWYSSLDVIRVFTGRRVSHVARGNEKCTKNFGWKTEGKKLVAGSVGEEMMCAFCGTGGIVSRLDYCPHIVTSFFEDSSLLHCRLVWMTITNQWKYLEEFSVVRICTHMFRKSAKENGENRVKPSHCTDTQQLAWWMHKKYDLNTERYRIAGPVAPSHCHCISATKPFYTVTTEPIVRPWMYAGRFCGGTTHGFLYPKERTGVGGERWVWGRDSLRHYSQ